MITLTLVDRIPNENPDLLIAKVAFSGNYGIQGAGDLMNLLGIKDPNGLGGWAQLAQAPTIPLLHLGENLGGYYTQLTLPVAPSFTDFGVQVFAPGGGELASNAAYPAAVLGGYVLIGIKIPPAV